MRKPKIREIREAVTALITGPYTAKFPFGPPLLQESFRGKPEYHEEVCIGCGACSEVCPAHAIEVKTVMKDGVPFRRLTVNLGICVYCGTCVEKCTTIEGITQTSEFDLASLNPEDLTEIIEKELAECEICGSAFATKDHLAWIYRRIGSLAAANWTLLLVGEESLESNGRSYSRSGEKIMRRDHMRILCPECRKSVILSEEWGNYE